MDWLIHNLDVCCWAKKDWPESAQGMGGWQVREEADQLFESLFHDHDTVNRQLRHGEACQVSRHTHSRCATSLRASNPGSHSAKPPRRNVNP